VKFDAGRGVPERDADGRCIPAAADEVGEAIGRIENAGNERAGRFDGYTAADETEKKVLRDAFEPSDAWFRSGDLMRRDSAGFYYFVDRIGDTFRWKGENVSASEVAAAITSFPGVHDAFVYGVSLPGADGRAGMAEIACTGTLDVAALRAHLAERLPRYALPVVVRVRRELELTPTFKQKTSAAQVPYDPATCPDPLYVNLPERGGYVLLDEALYARIRAAEVRL
jgi:fatty-acyl-CoA synthase